MTFQWADGCERFFTVEAQLAGETLEAIRLQNKGELTPDIVSKAAKPKSAPLHDCFEWDNEKAADFYRREQARTLIRSVRLVITDAAGADKAVHQYYNVTTGNGRSYQTRETIATIDEYRQQVIGDCLRYLGWAKARLAEIQGLETAREHIVRAEEALAPRQAPAPVGRKGGTRDKKRTVGGPRPS